MKAARPAKAATAGRLVAAAPLKASGDAVAFTLALGLEVALEPPGTSICPALSWVTRVGVMVADTLTLGLDGAGVVAGVEATGVEATGVATTGVEATGAGAVPGTSICPALSWVTRVGVMVADTLTLGLDGAGVVAGVEATGVEATGVATTGVEATGAGAVPGTSICPALS